VRTSILFAVAAGLAGALPAAAAAAETAAAVYSTCVPCHGDRGQGDPRVGAPNIAGLDATYVERQLRNFSEGRRGTGAGDRFGASMRAAAAALAGAEQRKAAAAYVAALAAVRVSTGAPAGGRLANGRNHFNAICSACHNSGATGDPALAAPRLAGTDPAYLLRQLAAFRSGTRGAAADDVYGGQMRKMAQALPDAPAAQDVIAYVATLPLPATAGSARP
jgi:cytochrome c oxidase subunit 2